jgi:hypothetical protein
VDSIHSFRIINDIRIGNSAVTDGEVEGQASLIGRVSPNHFPFLLSIVLSFSVFIYFSLPGFSFLELPPVLFSSVSVRCSSMALPLGFLLPISIHH